MRPVLVELVRPDQRLLRDVDVAEVARDVHVLPHRAPDDRDLAAHLDGDVDRLLHPVDVRREARDQDSALQPRDDLLERLADEPLEPVTPGRSAFVESPSMRSMPCVPSSASRPTSVRRPSTGVWSSFQSPVWRTAGGRLQDDCDRVGDRVRDPHEADAEASDLDGVLLRPGLLQLDRVQEPVLVQP